MWNAVRRVPASHWLTRFADEEHGATATEYGMLMAFIVMITMAAVALFGLALLGWYDELTDRLKLLLGIP